MPERLGPPRAKPLFERLALVGFGLIGSSIARAARHLKLAGAIVAIDAGRGGAGAGARARHRRRGDDRRRRPASRGADLVILCVPVGACGAVAAGDRGRRSKPGAIVSDVGSVKALGGRAGAAASADGRAFRAGASGRRHRAFGARCGLRDAVPQPLVHPDAAATAPTQEAVERRRATSGRRSARTSR